MTLITCHCGSYSRVTQVLDVSNTVAILHSSGHYAEALPSDGVHYWSSVGEEMDTPDGQHAAVIYKPAVEGHTHTFCENEVLAFCASGSSDVLNWKSFLYMAICVGFQGSSIWNITPLLKNSYKRTGLQENAHPFWGSFMHIPNCRVPVSMQRRIMRRYRGSKTCRGQGTVG